MQPMHTSETAQKYHAGQEQKQKAIGLLKNYFAHQIDGNRIKK